MCQDDKHLWSPWSMYDRRAISMGITGGFTYYRLCMKEGCASRQKAKCLVPHGETAIDSLHYNDGNVESSL